MTSRKFHFTAAFLLLSSFLLASAAAGSKSPSLKLGKEESLATAGLKLKIFKDSVQRPLPAISSVTLSRNKDSRVEAYNPMELWRHEQCVSYWESDLVDISIGALSLRPPHHQD